MSLLRIVYIKTVSVFCITVPNDDSEDTHQPKKGRLSSRMLLPGNTWQTVWEASKPVPARRQVKFHDSINILSTHLKRLCFPTSVDRNVCSMIRVKRKKFYISWSRGILVRSFN